MRELEAHTRERFSFVERELGYELVRVDELADGGLTLMYKNRDRALALAVSARAASFADASAGRLDAAGRLRPFDRDGFDVRDWWSLAHGETDRVAEFVRRHTDKLEAPNA